MEKNIFEKLLKMNEYEIVEQFSYLFFNMQYEEAMQIIGVMKSRGMDDARRLEMMLYFEQNNFAKIRNSLKGVVELGTEEKEFYLTALIELGLVDEFISANKEISTYERAHGYEILITIDCYYYLVWLINNQNLSVDVLDNIKYRSDMHSYFQRRYISSIVDELVEIYCLNEERLQLKDAGIDDEDTVFINDRIEKRFVILREIYYEADAFYNIYKEEKSLPIEMISFVAKSNIVYNGARGAGIYDIIHYMELHRKMNAMFTKEIVLEFEPDLKRAVKSNNEYVINFLKKTYLAICNAIDDSYKKVFIKLLGEVPFEFEDITIHKDENLILSLLSDKGKFAYKAALMQFTFSLEHDYGALDAGMLCLSYMRILELEVSQKIIIPLSKSITNIENIYLAGLNSYSDDKKKEDYKKKWSYIISELKRVELGEVDGFMMGAINNLFECMKVKRYKDKNSETLRACIDNYLSVILSDKGNNSISDLQRIFSTKNREKYRNPPAHTRYVGINTALECRSFVESNLILINECVR